MNPNQFEWLETVDLKKKNPQKKIPTSDEIDDFLNRRHEYHRAIRAQQSSRNMNDCLPEISMEIESANIVSRNRKLKTVWSYETDNRIHIIQESENDS